MDIFDGKINLLSKALNAYSLRHKVISANIANIGTPGYKAKTVEFENLLNEKMSNVPYTGQSNNPRHIDLSLGSAEVASPSIVEVSPDSFNSEEKKSGINDVDIDSEMAEMAKNQIRFKYVSKLLGESFRGIQKSIRGQI
jgi:flagellar basal-body rod protein FlgB